MFLKKGKQASWFRECQGVLWVLGDLESRKMMHLWVWMWTTTNKTAALFPIQILSSDFWPNWVGLRQICFTHDKTKKVVSDDTTSTYILDSDVEEIRKGQSS